MWVGFGPPRHFGSRRGLLCLGERHQFSVATRWDCGYGSGYVLWDGIVGSLVVGGVFVGLSRLWGGESIVGANACR